MLPTNDADLAAEFRERAKELRDRAAKFDRMADELDGGTPARKAETRRVSSARRQSPSERPTTKTSRRLPFDQRPEYPEAKRLFESGQKLEAVCAKVGLPRTTLANWRARGKLQKPRA